MNITIVIADSVECNVLKMDNIQYQNKFFRKQIRLKEYEYSLPGAYFITICTKNRKNYFWKNVGARIARPTEEDLSEYGITVKNAIESIPKHYSSITVDKYAIMPDHIHLLLQIHTDFDGRAMRGPYDKQCS